MPNKLAKFAVPVRVDETDTYTGYRKYQADSRIVTDEGK